jgi:hypothetical protein
MYKETNKTLYFNVMSIFSSKETMYAVIYTNAHIRKYEFKSPVIIHSSKANIICTNINL